MTLIVAVASTINLIKRSLRLASGEGILRGSLLAPQLVQIPEQQLATNDVACAQERTGGFNIFRLIRCLLYCRDGHGGNIGVLPMKGLSGFSGLSALFACWPMFLLAQRRDIQCLKHRTFGHWALQGIHAARPNSFCLITS